MTTLLNDVSTAGAPPATDEERWTALVKRDTNADGTFFYSVRTTGVYCRPSCAARLPRRENVGFHKTCREAEQAGFRPCKRCRPAETTNHRNDPLMRFAIGKSPLGMFLVAITDTGVSAILFGEDRDTLVRELQERFPKRRLREDDQGCAQAIAKVADFIEAPGGDIGLPLDMQGTAFQMKVWQALRDIPSGATASYAEVANRIGQPKGVRAVAQACAANNIAVAIPCHRVVRSDGSLSGYRWGVERKRALLTRESAS